MGMQMRKVNLLGDEIEMEKGGPESGVYVVRVRSGERNGGRRWWWSDGFLSIPSTQHESNTLPCTQHQRPAQIPTPKKKNFKFFQRFHVVGGCIMIFGGRIF